MWATKQLFEQIIVWNLCEQTAKKDSYVNKQYVETVMWTNSM